ncbi:MAG: hypothetical protein H6708_21075 [Kofleriaceae bacterium]|nr:hypothetical protein [Kofleriaceae bacterium]
MAERSSRTGPVVVVAIVVVSAGLIGGWLWWWKPRQERAEARAQITAWEQRWHTARQCLLGDPPLASDPGDALAIGALASGRVDNPSRACLESIKVVTRPDGGASALDEVEAAWREVEAAIPAVAQAYALYYSARPDEADRRLTALGVAITALDAAQDRLRGAAGLGPLVRDGAARVTALAAPTPVALDGVAVEAAAAGTSTGGALIWQQTYGAADREVRIMTAPTAGTTVTWPDGALAQPGRGWFAYLDAPPAVRPDAADPDDDVRVYQRSVAPDDAVLDDVGAPAAVWVSDVGAAATPALVAALPPGATHEVVAALGDGDERLIVTVGVANDGDEDEDAALFFEAVTILASTDGGKTWAPLPLPPAWTRVTHHEVWIDWRTGDVDLVLGHGGQASLLMFDGAHPLALPAPVELSVARLGSEGGCVAQGSAWWLADGAMHRARAGAATATSTPIDLAGDGDVELVDCAADVALVEVASTSVAFQRCTSAGCAQVFRGGTYAFGRGGLTATGDFFYVAGRGRILALWRGGATEPRYLRLPRAYQLHDVVGWGDGQALLIDTEDPARPVLAVPLP